MANTIEVTNDFNFESALEAFRQFRQENPTGRYYIKLPNGVHESRAGVFGGGRFQGLEIVRTQTVQLTGLQIIMQDGVKVSYMRNGYSVDMSDQKWPMAEQISPNAFDGCIRLISIRFSNQLKNVRTRAFYKCTGLTKISFFKGLLKIGEEAFCGCTRLKKLFLPEVDLIGKAAFKDCTKLGPYILLPETNIGESAFENCKNLTSVEFRHKQIIVVTAADGTRVRYGREPDNPRFFRKKTIGYRAFYGSHITRIYIPKYFDTSLGKEAFYNCHYLISINNPRPSKEYDYSVPEWVLRYPKTISELDEFDEAPFSFDVDDWAYKLNETLVWYSAFLIDKRKIVESDSMYTQMWSVQKAAFRVSYLARIRDIVYPTRMLIDEVKTIVHDTRDEIDAKQAEMYIPSGFVSNILYYSPDTDKDLDSINVLNISLQRLIDAFHWFGHNAEDYEGWPSDSSSDDDSDDSDDDNNSAITKFNPQAGFKGIQLRF